MLKKVLLGLAIFGLVATLGLFFWVRAVLGQEAVRTALAAQLSKALGQPVTIGGIGASIYPRVTVNLTDVNIGEPARVRVRTLHLGTAFGALLSRRIEHGSMRLDGARVELPLPPLTLASDSGASAPGGTGAPVEIVSIDDIVLTDVEIVSGGHTLRGDIEIVPDGRGMTLRRLTLRADDTAVEATGRITNVSGPVGELAIKAGELNVDRLLAFATEFSGGAGITTDPDPRVTSGVIATDLTVSLEAARATMGALTIDQLKGRAHVSKDGVTVDPIAFGLFGGRYDGTLAVTVGSGAPTFAWKATLSGIDVAAATTFAGSSDTVTGRLAGRIDLAGRGANAGAAIQSARGTVRVDVTDGVVNHLGLVRAVVVATSMRGGSPAQAAGGGTAEPFSRLGATLSVANGAATTQDLLFEGKDLTLAAKGTFQLDGSTVNLDGQVQLSDALTKQAGTDLVRYTQEQGRVTLPAKVTGSADNL